MSRCLYVYSREQDVLSADILEKYGELVASVDRNIMVVRADRLRLEEPHGVIAIIVLIDARTFATEEMESRTQLPEPDTRVRQLYALLAWAECHHIPTFPLLLDGTPMPGRQDLPSGISHLAQYQGMPVRSDTEEHLYEDLTSAFVQILRQTGVLHARLTLLWIALPLAVCAIGGIILLALTRNHWPFAVAEGAVVLALCIVTARIAYSPLGFYYFTFIMGLFGCLALSLGGAVLFSTSALGGLPRPGQNPPLATLATVMLLTGLMAYWFLSVVTIGAMHGSISVVTTPPTHPSGGLSAASDYFLSYRRGDSLAQCDRIERFLTDKGKSVFRDFNSILVGADFDRALREAIENTGTMLVLVGPHWLTMQDAQGRRRIDDPYDYVHQEIALALTHHKRIITLRLGGMDTLTGTEVPRDLADFTDAPSFRVRDDHHFTDDMNAVTAYLGKTAREEHRQSSRVSAVIVLGLVLALLFALVLRIVPFACDVRANATSIAPTPCIVAGNSLFQCLVGLSLAVSCMAAYVGAISKKRWRSLLSLLFWTALSIAGYLITSQPVVTISPRFALASAIAAWCATIGWLGALLIETAPTHVHLIMNRIQATVT